MIPSSCVNDPFRKIVFLNNLCFIMIKEIKEKGVNIMKHRILNSMVKVLTLVAFVCAASPSHYNCYEPEKPASLR